MSWSWNDSKEEITFANVAFWSWLDSVIQIDIVKHVNIVVANLVKIRNLLLLLLDVVLYGFVMFKKVAVLLVYVIWINVSHIVMSRLKDYIKDTSGITSIHGLTNSISHWSKALQGTYSRLWSWVVKSSKSFTLLLI